MKHEKEIYKDKLEQLPEDRVKRKEYIEDLKLDAALDQDREVDPAKLQEWLTQAKQGPKSIIKEKRSWSWGWAVASMMIMAPIVGLLTLGTLSIEDDQVSESHIEKLSMTHVEQKQKLDVFEDLDINSAESRQSDHLMNQVSEPRVVAVSKKPTELKLAAKAEGFTIDEVNAPLPAPAPKVVDSAAKPQPILMFSEQDKTSNEIQAEGLLSGDIVDTQNSLLAQNSPEPQKIPELKKYSRKIKKLSKDESFTIRTPSAIAGVRGTQFNVEGLSQGPISQFTVTNQAKAKKSMLAINEHDSRHQNEQYQKIQVKDFVEVKKDPKSTISIDVDTASYSNIRKLIMSGSLPPHDAVRLEEMINYFVYPYAQADGDVPFSVMTRLEPCPWNAEHRILHIGLQGKKVLERPKANLVFLLDVSGSMRSADKLPLLKRAFKLMLNNLDLDDRVAIVAYAGQTGVVLDSTSIRERSKIDEAIERLVASGSTNGEGGIQLAYRLAQDNFIQKGVNRIILATDGDFNVGVSNVDHLEKMIAQKRQSGIELSVLGFGRGNIRDDIMERLADHGNGNYAYIDTLSEARKALVSQLSSTLVTIAKDVKLQLKFDPEIVHSFKQIGYENRTLAHRDFDDDKKDAGEIGAGHTVTALYELKFVEGVDTKLQPGSLAIRYKKPQEDVSQLLEFELNGATANSHKVTWASVIAAFGKKLRSSHVTQTMSYETLLDLAQKAKGDDAYGYRSEAIKLMQQVADLQATGSGNQGQYPQWQFRK